LIYNESEQPCSLQDISETTPIITILEIQGIKFSQKSFHVPIVIKQIMLFQTSFTQYLIKKESILEKVEQPIEQPIEQPVEQPLEQPVEQPLEQPVEQPLKQPLEQPVEVEPDIKTVEVDINSLEDAITIKNPIEQYNEFVKKIKQSSLEAQNA
jgi:hypothetical protein